MSEEQEQRELDLTEHTTRRGLLGLTAGIAALLSALVALPVTFVFAAPLFRKQGEGAWVELGPVDEFGEERKEVVKSYMAQDGWYVAPRMLRVVVNKTGDENFEVLSTRCTHLGCGVTWKPEEQIFFCPCHNGEFNADGTVKAGPPPRPLPRLKWQVNPKTKQLEVLEV